MKVSMALLIFLPLACVAFALIQTGGFHIYAGWRRRSSRVAYEDAWEHLESPVRKSIPHQERLALLAAILPGHSTAIYAETSDASLRTVHHARRPALLHGSLLAECARVLEQKDELLHWTRSLRTLEMSSGIFRNRFRSAHPKSNFPAFRRIQRGLWPWRPDRASLYLVRFEPTDKQQLWAAGFFDERTYVPPGHVFEERLRKFFATPESKENRLDRVAPAGPTPKTSAVATTAGDQNRDANLARIIHDVRLPLTRLFAMVENLQDRIRSRPAHDKQDEKDQNDAPELEQAFARITRQLHTMESFTYDILNLETDGNADRDQKISVVDLAKHLHQIVDAHLDLIQRKRIEVVWHAPENGPSVLANPMALDRILFNLLTNSFQFCSSPGKIHLALKMRPRHTLLDIEDSGPGLVSQENTFELSRRNIGRGGSGWGIGLASARDLSCRLGGRLFPAHPRHGKGARFLLVLPGIPGHIGER